MAVVVIVVIVGVLVITSIVEINAQSAPYRQGVNRSFGALAAPLVNASTQTGRALAQTMKQAAGTASTRAGLQAQLDRAVTETATQSTDAANLVPPAAVGSLDQELVAVFAERAAAAASLRSTVDGLLGMTPLPVAGAPTSAPVTPAPPVTTAQAGTLLTKAGTQIGKADADYARVRRALARVTGPVRLPRSSWVTGPLDRAPLGSTQLSAAAPALAASPALQVVHQVLISAVGLFPPAVPPAPGTAGGVSVVGDNCPNPSSRPAVAPATVLPPTKRISTQVTVTNCGNVAETGIVVTTTVVPPGSTTPVPAAKRAGSALPPPGRRKISLGPGSSLSLAMGPFVVEAGKQYVVTAAVTVPAGQTNPLGAAQAFLVQISP